MRDCQHENIDIGIEETITTILRRRGDGSTLVDSEPGFETGRIEVFCFDCGGQWNYGRRRPKWLTKLIAEIQESSDENLN